MKHILDAMTDEVVVSLSGEAREFYDREFSFFNEVTSISGKLKPYIKRTKPEKKVIFLDSQSVATNIHHVLSRPKLTKKWQRYKLTSAFTSLVIQMA